jgi:beta-glucanase (GH16 family)
MHPIRHAAVLAAGLLAAALAVPLAPSSPVPAASAAPPGVAKPDCGARIAKPGGGNWTCTMVDQFSATGLDPARWMGMTQAGTGDLCIVNSPRTVAVANGSLRLSAIATDATTQCPVRADGTRASYASGWATTYRRFSQQYGRFEARIRVQAASAPGLHEAFWLWPDVRYAADSPWPDSGEIDIAETFSSRPDLAIPFLHYSDDVYGGVQGVNTAWNCPSTRGAWHTYALEWFADRLTILVDGRTCLTNTRGASSYQKPFIINLTQFLGNANNQYDGQVALPATMEVDYVKVWR